MVGLEAQSDGYYSQTEPVQREKENLSIVLLHKAACQKIYQSINPMFRLLDSSPRCLSELSGIAIHKELAGSYAE